MALARKFLFDVSFDAPDPPPEAAALAEPAFVPADIDAARAEGFAEGHKAALAEAAAAAEALAACALETLAGGLQRLFDAQREATAAIERDAVALLRAVLQRAVPALCRKDPLAELEALIAQCLAEALDEPRIVARVADAAFDAVEARLAPLARAAGYSGKLVLLADSALGPGDGRVEWADGGAERNTPRLMAELDAMLNRVLTKPLPEEREETKDE